MAFSGCRPLVLNDPATQVLVAAAAERLDGAPAGEEKGAGAGAGAGAAVAGAGGAVEAERSTVVKVHPVVLFSVLDHYLRRPEGQKRVIGTLLGKVNANVVEITSSFAVPHYEKADEVALGRDFNRQMFALQQQVNSIEKIVGWYATSYDGVQVVDNSSLIHDFYTQECDSPVHLVIDTSLKNDAVGCKAYVTAPLEIKGEALANVFHQLQVKVESSEAERICLDRMVKGQEGGLLAAATSGEGLAAVDSQMATLETSMERLLAMLREANVYVDEVVAGQRPADPHVGRRIANSVAAVPHVRPETFAKLFDTNLQDLLMVSYLSSLTRTQLAIAEKLQL
jgi:translation initiation factor 3 subunit F